MEDLVVGRSHCGSCEADREDDPCGDVRVSNLTVEMQNLVREALALYPLRAGNRELEALIVAAERLAESVLRERS
jgi:positive regulator of sigma E activity